MNDKLRILHFCALPLFSGLEQYALKMAQEQKKRGHLVEFVVLTNSALEKECAKSGIKTHSVDLQWPPPLLPSVRRYAEIIRQTPDVDVWHLHTSQEIDRLAAARLLATAFPGAKKNHKIPQKIPKIIQQNHIWISHSKKDPLHWLTYQTVDEIWCSSEPAKRDLVRFLPVPSEKIQVVRYGRDLALQNQFLSRQEARTKLGLAPTATILGAIARIDRGKGIWELLNSCVRLWQKGCDFELVVIGGPTLSDPAAVEFKEKVDQFAAQLSPEMKSRLHLKGAIDNAGNLLKAFDVYAQVSYKETFSLALLDAQLAELPVVGTNSGGTPEVVIEEQTGWLCKPEDINSLQDTIERALRDKESWRLFGSRARATVESTFDMNVIISEILSRYEGRQSERDRSHGIH